MEVYVNTIVKTVLELVKLLLRLVCTNAQKSKNEKNNIVGTITLINVPKDRFSHISSMYRHRSVTFSLLYVCMYVCIDYFTS